MSAPRYRHADRLEWSSHAKLSDVQPLIAKSHDEFTKTRAIWRDNLQRAADRTPSNAIVMGFVLANYVNRRLGYAWPTNELLMADTGWSESTVKRSIDDLKTGGWVMWCKLGFQQPNGYRLAFSPSVVAGVQERLNLRLGRSLRAVRSDLIWLGSGASQVISDLSVRSDLTSQSGQIWPPIFTKEPHQGTLEEGAADGKVEVSARGADVAPARPSASPLSAPPARSVPALIDDVDDEPSPAVPVLRDDVDDTAPAAPAMAKSAPASDRLPFKEWVMLELGGGNRFVGVRRSTVVADLMGPIMKAGARHTAGPLVAAARAEAERREYLQAKMREAS